MEEVELNEIVDPVDYRINLCFEWNNFDSCIEFQITVDGEIEDGDEAGLIHELIMNWDSMIKMDDETIINISQFKQAYVEKIGASTKKNKSDKVIRLVH